MWPDYVTDSEPARQERAVITGLSSTASYWCVQRTVMVRCKFLTTKLFSAALDTFSGLFCLSFDL